MSRVDDIYRLPAGLPVPLDDGACAHLRGQSLPGVILPSTLGRAVRMDELAGWLVVFCYPRAGRPGEHPPGGFAAWNAIPGARGCTPQTCAYRDRYAEFQRLGAQVFGVSTQSSADQQEMVARLHVPFEVLSDGEQALSRALRLPTFQVEGLTLLKRLTFVAKAGRIEEVFYPVFPPDGDAERVLLWLDQRCAGNL